MGVSVFVELPVHPRLVTGTEVEIIFRGTQYTVLCLHKEAVVECTCEQGGVLKKSGQSLFWLNDEKINC